MPEEEPAMVVVEEASDGEATRFFFATLLAALGALVGAGFARSFGGAAGEALGPCAGEALGPGAGEAFGPCVAALVPEKPLVLVPPP